MPAKQVLEIKVLTCGGMLDLMSEQEAAFLVTSLGLFRNVQGIGRATPRANVNLVRAYTSADFYRSVDAKDDILHVITHGTANTLQTGNGKSGVLAADLEKRAKLGKIRMPEIVVSTVCGFQSRAWQSALSAAGVEVLIASKQKVTPANLTAFDMAFYSALLAQVRRGTSTIDRVKKSFTLANKHYRSIHAAGTPYARFELVNL